MADTHLHTLRHCRGNGDIPLKKSIFLAVTIALLATPSIAYNLTMQLENSTGNQVGADYEVYKDGELVNSSTGSIDVDLNNNENYTVKEAASTSRGWFNVTYYSFNITQDLNPQTQLTEQTLPNDKTFLTNLSKTYTVETDNLSFKKSKIRISSQSQPNRVAHCLNYDFQTSECSNWEVNSTGDFSSSYSSEIFEFNVTEFDGYSTGTTAPYPNVTEIRIYDVSDTMDDRDGGNLEAEGFNSTFKLPQYGSAEYRFEFQVFNNGSETWSLLSEDTMFEDALDSSWSVPDIWYFLGEDRTGGTFSNGKVSWDTGNGGDLEVSTGNETLTASFVLDLNLDSSQITENLFKVQDESEGTGTDVDHTIRWKKLGDLNVTIQEPVNDTVVPYQEFFTVNASVECLDGGCGEVKASTRYNSSEGFELISESQEEPFYTNQSNEKICGTLSSGENCYINWSVNATGNVSSYHKIDINASSNFTEIPEKSSSYSEIQINEIILMDLTWNTTDFGNIDPGEEKAAEGNDDLKYNITFDEKSTKADGLWIKGTDLISEADDSYSINISNVTTQTDRQNQNYSVQTNYTKILSDISGGSEINTKYWLDAPFGITAGRYNGNITFKANTTS